LAGEKRKTILLGHGGQSGVLWADPMPPPPSSALLARRTAFRAALLRWHRAEARRLPWREEPSLYRTIVSEFMLQQTQVKTMLPYFERWMAALPDLEELAAASEAMVLKLWEGLGYYSRARNLHRLARELVALPAIPRASEAWLELPGVGPYTAAAVTSIAFGTPAACVDGNVVRVLARLTADRREFPDGATAAKAFAPLAQELVSVKSPGDHNQAMMELGAMVCVRQNPRCVVCPVQAFCAGFRGGDPTAFPRLAARRTERREVIRVWCERRGKLLLHRAEANARRLAGQYELPTVQQAGFDPGLASPRGLMAKKRRSITRFQITESIYLAPAPRNPKALGLEWVPFPRLDAITLSGPHRKWIGEILGERTAKGGRVDPPGFDQG
jgi:A/G-specific adenine glycosylase